MEQFTYRIATLEDFPLIIETRKKIMLEGAWKNRNSLETDIEGEKKNIFLLIKEEWLIFCLAYRGNTFAGMGALLDDLNRSNAEQGKSDLCKGYFYTVPEFRKQGVMHGIAEVLIRTAKERGCEQVHIYHTENKYRESFYEMGFRDIIDMDEGRVFVNGDEMEIPDNGRREEYQSLQPLRIPAGWTVVLNKFEDIEPDNASKGEMPYSFNESILYLRAAVSRKRNGKAEKQTIDIDLTWYPDEKFVIRAVLDRDWYEPLLEFSSRSKIKAVQTLEKWLFVEFMPTRFIDENAFRKSHKSMKTLHDGQRKVFCNLQPLRIPDGWSVVINKLKKIEPEEISEENKKTWLYSFNEEILYICSDIVSDWGGKTEKQTLAMDLGWYPDGDLEGKFTLRAVLDNNRDEPLLDFSSRSKAEIVRTLEKWLFIKFVPRCFIDKAVFRKIIDDGNP